MHTTRKIIEGVTKTTLADGTAIWLTTSYDDLFGEGWCSGVNVNTRIVNDNGPDAVATSALIQGF